MRRVLGFAVPVVLAASAAATPRDVPRDHWARGAIDKVVAAGLLPARDGEFRGESYVNRFGMADLAAKVLDQQAAPAPAPRVGVRDVWVGGMRAQLADIHKRAGTTHMGVRSADDHQTRIRGMIDRIKAGRMRRAAEKMARREVGARFGGLFAAGLVATDNGGPAGTAAFRTRYTGTPNQTFFTVPRASVTLDADIRPDVRLYVQADYFADRASRGLLPANRNMGLSEAYVEKRLGNGMDTVKFGGFAAPFSSWEVDGPARSATHVITPSVVNTFFETLRFVGLEWKKSVDGTEFHLALTNGFDTGITGVPPGLLGNFSDATGLGQLTRVGSSDDRVGYYADLKTQLRPGLEGRVGLLDFRGDPNPKAPALPTVGIEGWHAGLRWRRDRFEGIAQHLRLTSDIGNPAGIHGDNHATSLSLGYQMGRDRLTVRRDIWSNEASTLPITGTSGRAWSAAVTRELAENRRLQLEWIDPDEQVLGAPRADRNDTQFQLRYTVSF